MEPGTIPKTVVVTPHQFEKEDERHITPIFADYVTRNRGFFDYLTSVRDQINTYVAKPVVRRPLNILLAAPPGSGKSFLIKQIIAEIKSPLQVSFEETYVASLDDVTELYSIFQRVQSLNLEGKLPVVFFDEIDTAMGPGHLYAKFLAPMWDGTFYIGKEKFFLGRSIFFFAGSTLSEEKESVAILEQHKVVALLPYDTYFNLWKTKFDDANAGKGDKIPDFMDRIDAIIRIPPMSAQLLGSDWRAEYEDLGCMLIRKHFPKVQFVGKEALQIICDKLINANSMRTAEKIIFNSRVEDEDTFDVFCLPQRFRPASLPDSDGEREKLVWKVIVDKPAKPVS